MKQEEKIASYVLAAVIIALVIVSNLPDYTLLWNI